MDGVDISLIKSDGDEEYTHILDDYFEFDNDLHKKLVNLRKKLSIYDDLKTNINELEDFCKQVNDDLKTKTNEKEKERIVVNVKDEVDKLKLNKDVLNLQ